MHREIRRGGEKDAHKQVAMLISSRDGACLVLSQNKDGSFRLLIAPSMVAIGISNESEVTKSESLSVNAALPLRFDAGSASQSEKSSPPQTDWIRES